MHLSDLRQMTKAKRRWNSMELCLLGLWQVALFCSYLIQHFQGAYNAVVGFPFWVAPSQYLVSYRVFQLLVEKTNHFCYEYSPSFIQFFFQNHRSFVPPFFYTLHYTSPNRHAIYMVPDHPTKASTFSPLSGSMPRRKLSGSRQQKTARRRLFDEL